MSLQTQNPNPVADPALEAGELIIRLGVFVLAVGIPCAAVVSRRTIFSLTPIGAILLLVGALLALRRTTQREFLASFLTPMSLALIFLTLWGGLSLAWTPWPASGGPRFVRTAGTLLIVALAGDLAPARTKTANLYLLPFGVGVASSATLCFALYYHARLAMEGVSLDDSTLARASVGAALLVWPALAALAVRERWVLAATLACVSAAAVLAVGSLFAIAGIVAGALIFVVSLSRPKAVGRFFAVLIGGLFAFGPLLALGAGALVTVWAHPPELLAPATVWADFVKTEGLRLVTGHGLDTAGRAAAAGLIPAEAPRSILWEIWYELGIVGALAAACLSVAAFLAAANAPRPLAPFLLAALACGFALAFSALPTAQLWWVTLASLAALFFAVAKRGRYRTRRPHVSLVNAESRPRQPA